MPAHLPKKIATEMRALRGTNAETVIARMSPIIRGWAAYYRSVVSGRVFSKLDTYMWQLQYKWATWTHPNKPKDWTVKQYFGTYHATRQDKWVFGDRKSGAYLPKLAWTKIVRHQAVQDRASPDDPAWPITGPDGGAEADPHSTAAPCACSNSRTGAAISARATSCTPTANRIALSNGSNGSWPPAKRSPSST